MHITGVTQLSTGDIVRRDDERFLILARVLSAKSLDTRKLVLVKNNALLGRNAFVEMELIEKRVSDKWWEKVYRYDRARDVSVLDLKG